MKLIKLTQNKVAVVDDEDFEELCRLKWCARKVTLENRTIWYAIHNLPRTRGRTRKVIWMHRKILGFSNSKEQVDHKNGDGLYNCKENLRQATKAQNGQNSRKNVNCSSQFKGVTWNWCNQKWRARITINGQRKHLGYFDDEKEAARAYDAAAKQLFGTFALLNF